MILEAAKKFKSSKDAKSANHWWDDECKSAIQETNEARGKCLIRKTRTNLDIHHQKRTKANIICRRKKKKECIEGKIKDINETNRKRDTRKFYKDVRNLSSLPTVTTLVCKDNKDENILSEKKQILERWQQYFKELLNPETGRINSIKTYEVSINNVELEEPTYEEINEIIKNMKPYKAAGRITKS